ncbi:hypothetical protein HHK36_026396 [Tetracentron sinense]|uniref:histidine kinase n=1 Tax=Tetracentron sinense TaxID=13715 RepID=A0A834YKA9_TETSI|nr:hypothetical protein HHK36_026396 [Tetracentron sinense]
MRGLPCHARTTELEVSATVRIAAAGKDEGVAAHVRSKLAGVAVCRKCGGTSAGGQEESSGADLNKTIGGTVVSGPYCRRRKKMEVERMVVELLLSTGFAVLLIPSLVISIWSFMTRRVEQNVKLDSYSVRIESLSEIETTARLLLPINSSAANLARVMSAYLIETKLSFSVMETSVAPYLFLALSTIPHLAQISYIGFDGLLFSYYNDGDQTIAIYSNTSFSSNDTTPIPTILYTWYTQPVNRSTGKRYGDAIRSNPMPTVNASWFQEALNSTNGHASLGTGWNKAQDRLFLNTAPINGKGVISLGFPVEALIDFFSDLNLHGGDLYMATEDGEVLIQTGPPNTRMVFSNDTVLVQLMKSNGDLIGQVGNISCQPINRALGAFSNVNIREMKYMFYCSHVEIGGIQAIYGLAFPHKGLVSLVHNDSKLAFILLSLMLVSIVVSISIFMFLIARAARREMLLCAALIKQMEATQQAERKSMNKSLAFASASHDVRASLAAITGLIELCHQEVVPDSDLAENLVHMNSYTGDLLGILNSVLDTSKIEAGKMQLEEVEFDLAQLLEEVVDMYYPVGMKKHVDVLLDPCDASIRKLPPVKGDRGKLKQILSNLLSNAVKFTSEGHVSVRAWVKKPSLKNYIIASNRNGMMNRLSRLFCKKTKAYNDLKALHTVQPNQNSMEFVFEVDDTGKGIPKEKQKSVFENFVQVKETALGQGGTGLGLGIVQSLVRLMGGEIGIVDKELGKRGTCFKFNIFLTTCETMSVVTVEGDVKVHGDHVPRDLHQHSRINIRTPSPKLEGSHVVLLIRGDERRRISQKFMESQGIKVSAVKQWEYLVPTLEKIKRKLFLSHSTSGKYELGSFSDYLSKSASCNSNSGAREECFVPHFEKIKQRLYISRSSSGKSEFGSFSDYLSKSASRNSNSGTKDGLVDAKDGTDHILPLHKKLSPRGTSNFMLIVIDASAGPFSEMCSVMAGFKKDLDSRCKVVWLDEPTMRSIHLRVLEEDKLVAFDHIISKPFHGSRLFQVIGLLPEYGGTMQVNLPKPRRETTVQIAEPSTDPSSSIGHTHIRSKVGLSPSHERVVVHERGNPSSEKPLSGKKVLVAEDDAVLRKVATIHLSRLGARVELCENGEEALEQVCKALSDQRVGGIVKTLPYDYIFMDCEMPIMNGYEATRQIRKEEERYNVHIPIIALTAHATGEETNKTMQAGMDFHLTKPLQKDQLLDAIQFINSR